MGEFAPEFGAIVPLHLATAVHLVQVELARVVGAVGEEAEALAVHVAYADEWTVFTSHIALIIVVIVVISRLPFDHLPAYWTLPSSLMKLPRPC